MSYKIGKGNFGWQKSEKPKKKAPSMGYKKCIIGIDQSYTRTGISIAVDGELKKVTSVNLTKIPTKTMKRRTVNEKLKKCIEMCIRKYGKDNVGIICERIRTITNGFDIRPNVIKPAAAMISNFVDVAYDYELDIWSVDTRCWKSAILGTSKPIFEPIEGVSNIQKFGSVRRVIELGFYDSLVREGRHGAHYTLDDDAADSACIALYGFVKNKKLMKEI